jgi:hypothetical protein
VESTLSILLTLVSTQFKAEYDAITDMLDNLEVPREVVVTMVSEGGGGGLADTAAKDTAEVDASYAGMATGVSASTGRMADDTEQHMSMASNALGGVSRDSENMAKDTEGSMKDVGESVGGIGGMLGQMLPIMATIGFGAIIYGSMNTAVAIKNFQEQTGASIAVAKQWVTVASTMDVAPRALTMTLKSVDTMLLSVTDAQKANSAASQAEASVTDAVTQAKENLLIKQADLTNALDKYGNSTTAAATAEEAVQQAEEAVTKAEDKLATSRATVLGLTTKQSQAVQDLGIKLTGANGQTITSTGLILELANAYDTATNKADATADITSILGGRAVAMLPLIEQGGPALQALLTASSNATAGMTQNSVNALDQMHKNVGTIVASVKTTLTGFAVDLEPFFTYLTNNIGVVEALVGAIGGLYLAKGAWKLGENILNTLKGIVSTGINAAKWILNIGSDAATNPGGGGLTGAARSAFIQKVFVTNMGAGGMGGGGTNPLATAGEDTGIAVGSSEVGAAGGVLGVADVAAAATTVVASAAFGGLLLVGVSKLLGTKSQKESNAETVVDPVTNQSMTKATQDMSASAFSDARLWAELTGNTSNFVSHVVNNLGGISTTLDQELNNHKSIGKFTETLAALYKNGELTSATQISEVEALWNSGITSVSTISQYLNFAAEDTVDIGGAFGTAKLNAYGLANNITGVSNQILGMVSTFAKSSGLSNAGSSNIGRQAAQNSWSSGGITTENIIGIGANSGESYLIHANEAVVPLGSGGGGGSSGGGAGTTLYVDLRGTQVFKTSDLTYLVNLIGQQIAQKMLPQAGVQMQFKR